MHLFQYVNLAADIGLDAVEPIGPPDDLASVGPVFSWSTTAPRYRCAPGEARAWGFPSNLQWERKEVRNRGAEDGQGAEEGQEAILRIHIYIIIISV